jgi:acyl carrier protein
MNRINIMILALEQEFGIRYDEEQVVSMLSVGEIIDATKGMLGLQ